MIPHHQSALLEHEFILTADLKVMTNGTIQITSGGEIQLQEGRKVSMDGFWMNDDGTLVQFKPHYLVKERELFFVEDGVFTRVDHDLTFYNGAVLGTDGIVTTRDQRKFQLQDGQALTADGKTLPALDQVMMINGQLVLQKDGSIVPLPIVSTMGMSEGTRVKGNGMITSPNGSQFTLKEGQRIILAGAAMSAIE
jgi:hypothetical protein